MRPRRRRSSARTAIADKAVFDASVVLRAAVAGSPSAREWLARLDADLHGHAPDSIWIEVANGLRRAVLAGIVETALARRFLDAALRLPITLRSHRDLALPAFDVALDRGLSAYDAGYVVLAEALDAILVTADRTLAAAVPGAELIA